jgi:hypothetical protein
MGDFRQLSQQELKENLTYNPATGEFRRLKPTKRVKVGEIVGNLNNQGYSVVYVGWKPFLAHRLAWLYVYGEMPSMFLDHINGDRSDNRIANLRPADKKQNLWNVKRHSDNKSGYKGVHFHSQTGKWRAQGMANGKRHHLGLYETPELAHSAYCDFARNAFGEYARAA